MRSKASRAKYAATPARIGNANPVVRTCVETTQNVERGRGAAGMRRMIPARRPEYVAVRVARGYNVRETPTGESTHGTQGQGLSDHRRHEGDWGGNSGDVRESRGEGGGRRAVAGGCGGGRHAQEVRGGRAA